MHGKCAEEIDFMICEYATSLSVNYVEESVYQTIEKILIKIKLTISKMREFAKSFKKDIETQIKALKLPFRLRQIKKNLEKSESNGESFITMLDYEKFNDYYIKKAHKLMSDLKKLSNIKRYSNGDDFKKDVDKFDSDIEKFKNEMKKIESNPIKIPIKKAINFIDDEISGRSKVWKTYIGIIDEFDHIEIQLERFQRDQKIVSDTYLMSQHVGAIGRCMQKAQRAFQNFASKIITACIIKAK